MRTKFAFLSALFLLLVGQVVFAQVTGSVQDDFGPVSDAEVTVRGSETSTTTDENGMFSIDAKVGDVLVVADAMGNTQDFTVDSNRMGVLQFGSVELEAVTVTGSVFDPTSNSKSGVTVIDSEALETLTPSMSVDQMLAGKVSGLNSVGQQGGAPGGVANVVIRGALGLNGGNKSPLYVVNGTYMNEDDVNSINPNDIESIEVLKEAAKLAVFGSRGANGVIVIKTKSARKGQSIINYKTSIGYSELMKLPNFEVMSSSQLLNFENQLSALTNPVTGTSLGIGVARTPEEIAELSRINTDWEDEFTKGGFLTSHYLSIASGSEKQSTNFSIGYDDNSGNIIYYDGFQRITSTFNTTVAVNDRFNYGLNVGGAYTTRDNPRDRNNDQSPFYSILNNRPYSTVYLLDDNGNTVLDEFGDPRFNTVINSGGYTALDEMKYTDLEFRNFRLFGSGYLALEVFKNVTARSTFGATYDRYQAESFGQPRSILSGLLGYNGYKSDSSTDRLDYNWQNEVTYANSWGDHNVRATVATEYINESTYSSRISGDGFPNNTQNVMILANNIDQSPDTNTNRWEISRFGYLATANYDFASKYFIGAYVRRDGTSLAGLDAQYGTFWGAEVAWDIAKETFANTNSGWLNELRLSFSYGEGGDDSGLGLYSNILSIAQQPNAGIAGAYPGVVENGIFVNQVANSLQTWENNKKLNVGLDFEFFNRRLNGSFAFFNDKRTDFLFDDILAPEAGSPVITLNAGELENQGMELELSYDVLRSKEGFNLNIYGNITSIGYKINSLSGGLTEIFPANTFEAMIHRVGETPFNFYMVRYAGVDPSNGDALYYDINGNITNVYSAEDAVMLDKSPLPTLYGGFGLNASYKGVGLRADFNYQSGAYSYNNTYFDLMNINPTANGNNYHIDAANYWQNPGDTNVFQRPTAEGLRYTDQMLEKSDYILFRSLELSYTFDSQLFERLPIKGFRLFAQAQNLAVWSNYKGNSIIGTGSSESSNVTSEGYVSGAFTHWSYPLSRVFTLGVNLTF